MPATADAEGNLAVRELLQAAVGYPFPDWFEYRIGPAMMDLTAAPFGGARYHVEASMDGRIFAKFHLDIGIGDVVMQPLETVEAGDWLAFAGIDPPQVQLIPREQQFAEKIHAYTLPRNTPNSRVKDLVDLALLIRDRQLDRQMILNALLLTFERRKTHPLPTALDAPPPAWAIPFTALAEECGLQSDLAATFKTVQGLFIETLACR